MKELCAKLDGCFDRLQNLQIKPTLGNMEILVQTLYDLREVYSELERMKADGRAEADPKEREDH